VRPWVHPDSSYWLHRPRNEEDWKRLAREYTKEDERRLLNQVLDVARAGGCRTVVVENRYVDVDYRSEYSAFWSKKFDSQSPFARRFHFFAADLDEERLHCLTDQEAGRYLGYSVIRPVLMGASGAPSWRRRPNSRRRR
jgi:hypothetical protein